MRSGVGHWAADEHALELSGREDCGGLRVELRTDTVENAREEASRRRGEDVMRCARVHASSSTAADSTSSRSVSAKRAAGAPSITAWSTLSVTGSMGRTTT